LRNCDCCAVQEPLIFEGQFSITTQQEIHRLYPSEVPMLDIASDQAVNNVRPAESLAQQYREIGVPAVLAALCVLSEPAAPKDLRTMDDRSTAAPEFLFADVSAD
jgi:hypothetical protein